MSKDIGITGMGQDLPISRDMKVGEELGPRLYTAYRDGKPYAYAYGASWVAMALYMDDIKFDTPEEAKAWWDKNYGITVETNIFDEVEEHENCTVQILKNSVTGEQSIGWWPNES